MIGVVVVTMRVQYDRCCYHNASAICRCHNASAI